MHATAYMLHRSGSSSGGMVMAAARMASPVHCLHLRLRLPLCLWLVVGGRGAWLAIHPHGWLCRSCLGSRPGWL